MAANTSLDLVQLDFDGLKEDLKNYLKTQPIFKDYDFEGSNINVLLDILSYNTVKNLFFLNMAISEGFIDSAQLKTSILSHAKELNYTPRSIQSAVARVRVDFEASGDTQPYIIQKGETFTSLVRNSSFIFSVPDTITCASSNTTFSFETDIYEGSYQKDSYIYLASELNPHPTFEISNESVDTRSIVVSVFEDGAVVGQNYSLATSLLDLDSTSKVYFLQVSAVTGKYEILFGDGIIGRQPKSNAIILIDYRVSRGDIGNGCSVFTINFNPTGAVSEIVGRGMGTVTTISNSISGKDAEDIETTRFYAPRYFETQERAVVASDYEVMLKVKFPEINNVTAYGGDELNPPQYGKVVICVNIDGLEELPDSKIIEYYNFIKNRCPLTIIPIFTNPEFTYLIVKTNIKYNINVTTKSDSRIKTLVTDAITTFAENNINDFNSTFYYSALIKAINEADYSILSNETNISLCKQFNPDTVSENNYVFDFQIPLEDSFAPLADSHSINVQKTLWSSSFTYKDNTCWLEDDGAGTIRIVSQENQNYVKIIDVGSIAYSTGGVVLTNFVISDYVGNYLKIYVKPKNNDISINQNTLLLLNTDNLTISTTQLSV